MGVIKRTLNMKGVTLLELLAVVVILGILSAIAVPIYMNSVEKAERDICFANRLEVRKHFEVGLTMDGLTHSDFLFKEFLAENKDMRCPVDGGYSYLNKEVVCDMHEDIEDDDDDDEVPWL